MEMCAVQAALDSYVLLCAGYEGSTTTKGRLKLSRPFRYLANAIFRGVQSEPKIRGPLTWIRRVHPFGSSVRVHA